MEKDPLLPLGLDGLQTLADVADILAGQGEIGLAHVAELNRLANHEHFLNGLALLAYGKKQHVLKNEIQIEFLHHRAASGTGLNHAHQLHAFDGFPQHVAADAEHLAHGLLRRKRIAGFQLMCDNIAANFAKRLDIQLILFQVPHGMPFQDGCCIGMSSELYSIAFIFVNSHSQTMLSAKICNSHNAKSNFN